ncbi:MAG: hypothetical protein GX316_06840 [Firmicutes bacterium]|nr:hypothetical protein [Bacillota bacterium]
MWILILWLASVLLAFAVGRRLGFKSGFKLGTAFAGLDLRRRSLEQGKCLICSQTALQETDLESEYKDLEPSCSKVKGSCER